MNTVIAFRFAQFETLNAIVLLLHADIVRPKIGRNYAYH